MELINNKIIWREKKKSFGGIYFQLFCCCCVVLNLLNKHGDIFSWGVDYDDDDVFC